MLLNWGTERYKQIIFVMEIEQFQIKGRLLRNTVMFEL
jgi:hypothetical protein